MAVQLRPVLLVQHDPLGALAHVLHPATIPPVPTKARNHRAVAGLQRFVCPLGALGAVEEVRVRAKGESESACPRRAETYFTFSPSEIRRLAAVWRRSWKRGFGSASFASLTAFPSRPEGPQDRVAAAFLSFA